MHSKYNWWLYKLQKTFSLAFLVKGYRQSSRGFMRKLPSPVLILKLTSLRRVAFSTFLSRDWAKRQKNFVLKCTFVRMWSLSTSKMKKTFANSFLRPRVRACVCVCVCVWKKNSSPPCRIQCIALYVHFSLTWRWHISLTLSLESRKEKHYHYFDSQSAQIMFYEPQ